MYIEHTEHTMTPTNFHLKYASCGKADGVQITLMSYMLTENTNQRTLLPYQECAR